MPDSTCGPTAFETDHQAAAARDVARALRRTRRPGALARDRDRLTGPAGSVARAHRASSVANDSVDRLGRQREHLQRDLRHDAERAEGTRERAADVVPGDVLHHAAAGRRDAGRDRRSVARPARNRGPHRRSCGAAPDSPDATAPPRVAPRLATAREMASSSVGRGGGAGRREMRRLERQHLPLRGEQRLDVGKRRSATGPRAPARSARSRRYRHVRARRSRRRRPDGRTRPSCRPPRIGERRLRCRGLADRVDQRAAAVRRGDGSGRHDGRHAAGLPRVGAHRTRGIRSAATRDAVARRRCTCMRPPSAQRRSVGTPLSGLRRPSGSNARLTPRNPLELGGRELDAHLRDLLDAHAVLAGDGAAQRHTELRGSPRRSPRRASARRRRWRRTAPADAGCRRPRGRRWDSAGGT